MPLIILSVAVQLLCLVHAARTGRASHWYFIIMMGSFIGCIAYFLVEVVPELRHSRAARQVSRDVSEVVDPDRNYREALDRLDAAMTIDNLIGLARACADRGQLDDAIRLFGLALTGVNENDPRTMIELAAAQFRRGLFTEVIATLDQLREANPDYQSQDGHLLYARALNELGDTEAADEEFAVLVTYFSGEEARCRYALLLLKSGRVEEARQQFEAVVCSVDRASRHYFRSQRDWYAVAKQNLA